MPTGAGLVAQCDGPASVASYVGGASNEPKLSFLEKIDLVENWSIYCVPLRRCGCDDLEGDRWLT